MSHDNDINDIVLFYAEQSLIDQVCEVAADADYSVAVSMVRGATAIRNVMRNAAVGIIDATADPSGAAQALAAALQTTPPRRVAVYTEVKHTGLELFVRVRGPFLLMGPMNRQQWEDYIAYAAAEPSLRTGTYDPRIRIRKTQM